MRFSPSKQFTQILRLVHRQGGLILSVFLLLLSITGVMLNHTTALGLAEKSVPAGIAARYYQDEQLAGYQLDGHYFYLHSDVLYYNDQAVNVCTEELTGVALLKDEYVVGCGSELILVSSEGQFVERLGQAHGIPANISAVGSSGEKLLFRLEGEVVEFDLLLLTRTATQPDNTADANFNQSEMLPSEIALQNAISWEQFLLDVHSGHYFTAGGIWLMDLAAICLVLLSLSGIVMFLLPKEPRRRSH